MIKKLFQLVLVCLLVFAFVGCNATTNNTTPITTVAPSTPFVSQTQTTEQPSGTLSPITTPAPTPTQSDPNVSKDLIIFDEGDITITAKSIDYDNWYGPSLIILIENNSSTSVTVQTRNSVINGYMIDSLVSEQVAPGKKSVTDISFSASDMELCGITEVQDIEFTFHIFNSDTWDTIIDSSPILLTTDVTGYTQVYDDSGLVLYDEDGIRIIAKNEVRISSTTGLDVFVYIENNTDHNITVQTRDESVNGFMTSAIFSCDVLSGKKAVDDISFMQSSLDENGITDIEEIELRFHIFDSDTWDNNKDTDMITISFK